MKSRILNSWQLAASNKEVPKVLQIRIPLILKKIEESTLETDPELNKVVVSINELYLDSKWEAMQKELDGLYRSLVLYIKDYVHKTWAINYVAGTLTFRVTQSLKDGQILDMELSKDDLY